MKNFENFLSVIFFFLQVPVCFPHQDKNKITTTNWGWVEKGRGCSCIGESCHLHFAHPGYISLAWERKMFPSLAVWTLLGVVWVWLLAALDAWMASHFSIWRWSSIFPTYTSLYFHLHLPLLPFTAIYGIFPARGYSHNEMSGQETLSLCATCLLLFWTYLIPIMESL